MANTSQQVGGSIGTALMSTIAASATAAWAVANPTASAQAAAVEGWLTAFWWAAGVMALAAIVSFVLVRFDQATADTDADLPEPAMAI